MRSQSILCLAFSLALAGCPFGSSDDGDDVNLTGNEVDAPEGDGEREGATVTVTGDEPMDIEGDGDEDDDDGGAAGSSGGDGDGGGEGAPVPLSGLPAAFAGAICDALEACVGPARLRELMAREECSARVATELEATDFAHMDMAIAAGRVLYDPAKLAECEAGIRAMECDVIAYSYPQACVDVLQGNVEIDGECVISAECAGTAFCGGTESCPSTCTALLEEGGSCSGDSQCGDGLRCIGGECAPPSPVDGECGGTSGKVCALGLNCLGATDVNVGSCVLNADIQVGGEGDECAPGGELCQDGLSCTSHDGVEWFCEGAVEADGDCHLALPGQCPADQYCNTTVIGEQATCTPWPGDGEACVLNGKCAAGHACVPEGSSAVCRAIQDNGGSCGADAACRSGNCVGGACMPPPSCI